MSWSDPPVIYGDDPPMDPLRVVHLTPGQLRHVIRILDAARFLADRDRGYDDHEAVAEVRQLETILETLGQAL